MIKPRRGLNFYSSLETKADDEREMVAEATLIAVAIIGTEGLYATVLFVFFKEEGGVVDVDSIDRIAQSGTNKDMVDALPLAFVAIGTLSPMIALSIAGNVMQAVCL